jgi:hypothetical protein
MTGGTILGILSGTVFRMGRRPVRYMTPMELDGTMALGTAHIARLVGKRICNWNAFPVANLLTIPHEGPLHFAFINSVIHGL